MKAEFIVLGILIAAYLFLQYLQYRFIRNKRVREVKRMSKEIISFIKDTVILKKSYIKIKVLEKNVEARYIKFGVEIGEEGVVDALLGNSPLDEIKAKIKYFVDATIEYEIPYKIDVVLIES
jgi:hypothetical protein